MADLICRWRNGTPQNVVEVVNSMPHYEMPESEFKNYMLNSVWGTSFAKTVYQFAKQLALYYITDDGIYHPRFDHDITTEEAQKYMEHWLPRYYVPNPYVSTDGFNDINCPTYFLKSLYDYASKHPGCNYADAYQYCFHEIAKNNDDIIRNYINNYSKVLTFNKEGKLIITDVDPRKIFVHMERDDKKAFFDNFNYSDLSSKSGLNLLKHQSFLPAMRTKPFLLLAGISGTGKSQVVKEMAFATCPDIDDLQNDKASPGNYCMIEVKPNWHDSTELLGYDSAIKKRYVVTKFVKFVVKAMRYPNVPFFVCLDEMNLAPVEQYLAEFLSVLESRKLIGNDIFSEPLIDKAFFQDTLLEYDLFDIPLPRTGEMTISKAGDNNAGLEDYAYTWRRLQHEGLCIPQNLIVIGTVNMDETTHQFSRKVIDRAMTFEMNEANFAGYFQNKVTLDYVDEPLSADLFLARNVSGNRALDEIDNLDERVRGNVVEKLKELNKALDDTPFKIAYRVQNELVLYFAELLRENPNADQLQLLNTALDDIMMMKVLPRIEGDDELLGNRTDGALFNLMQFASNNNLEHSVDKIDEMLKRLERSHFTSYWP